MEREIQIELFGRVQGVNLRNGVKARAEENGLKGFVQNRDDGSVLLIAQGEEENLKELLLWVQGNPGFSKVEGVNYKWRDIGKEYPDFRVISDRNYIFDKAKSVLNLGKFLIGRKAEKVPRHIAVIPDGNRRWARKNGLEVVFGHYKAGSYDNIEEIFKEGQRLGVKYMSIWAFSTENWKREKKEVDAVFDVISKGVEKFRRDAEKNKIRFRHIGRKERIPVALREQLEKLEEETKNYDAFNVLLCLDYGGRDEILRAVGKIVDSGVREISEEEFSKFLDTSGVPDVDLIIRTGGEKRVSGYMPFQGTYAEFHFVDKYFPDFRAEDLRNAVIEYVKRQRRYGS